MSPQHLATELLQHIVEKLGEDNETEQGLRALVACSITNSALLHVSQKHIFRSVTLYEQDHRFFSKTPPESDTRCERTQLLLRTFQENPRFIAHVRSLSYHFSPDCYGSPGALLYSLRQFSNVETLLVGFYASPMNRGALASSIDEVTLSVVFDIMKRPHFRKLTVDSVLSFPMEIIRGAPGMQQLILRGSATTLWNGGVTLPALNKPCPSSLRTLVCDRGSMKHCVCTWLTNGASVAGLDILSRLERLEIILEAQDLSMNFPGTLLLQPKSLKELDLTVVNDSSHNTPPRPFTPPLRHLTKSSIQTLTHLSYKIHTHLKRRRIMLLPFGDPYLGLCDSPLSDLHSLETLHVDISFSGQLDSILNASAGFGTQWGALSDALVVPGAFPKLKEVKVNIVFHPGPVFDSHTSRLLESAFRVAGCLARFVKPQFRPLEEMCTERAIDFAFTQTVDSVL